MPEPFDVDVIMVGMGPGGEAAASRLLAAGRRVAVVERELIGGECAYWACIPSKTLLRPPEVRSEAGRAAGVTSPELDWPDAAAYRDYMTRHLDDKAQVGSYEERGAIVVRGGGRLAGHGLVEVGDQRIAGDHVILATGSDPVRPPIAGLDRVEVWTNREATQLREVPGRALVVGGGPVGLELGQLLARFGCQVTIVQWAERLIDREDPRVGELIEGVLADEGINVRVGRRVTMVTARNAATVVELDDGATIETDVVVLGAGRSPRVADLGLDTIGVEPGKRGVPVDEHCQVAPGLWAVGDVTGAALFTHVAKYQARVVVDNVLGRPGARTTAASRGSSSPTRRSQRWGSPKRRPSSRATVWRRPWCAWPMRSPDPGRTSVTHTVSSGWSPTPAAGCCSERGRSLRWLASGSTRRRSPSGPSSHRRPARRGGPVPDVLRGLPRWPRAAHAVVPLTLR